MRMRKALLVGIDKYLYAPLHCCCNDVDSLNSLLETHENGNVNFETKVLKNISKKSELKMAIENCFSGDTDVALFYYSGHGYIDAYGGYLATPDGIEGDVGVSLNEILNIVNQSRCKDKIIILDSCFSGKMGDTGFTKDGTAVISEGVTILTACRRIESSFEVNGHGVFTALLLDALDGGAADLTGHITVGGIYAYIDKALGAWEQRPVFKTNVTRFTYLREVVPQVGLDVFHKITKYFPNADDEFLLDPSYEPTNSNEVEHFVVEPYAIDEHTKIFSDLQKLESVGLVVPVDEKHMYFAAMNSKSCKLTAIGKQYWRLVDKKKI